MALRVLIVEDEVLIALHLEGILEDAGHEVVGTAASSSAALDLARRSVPFDLAIMDVDLLDGPNGVETARRLREEHGVASLFVSGRLEEEVQAMGLAWKPLGFIGKPFMEAQIIEALERIAAQPQDA
ncbi:response regulator [Aureimonas jatrophae]|uniref:Response regulator receiver domain-containing protein n=1 Tax=Aureimonas jatrophae TaxID=1166073 RepID=A0A1H0KB32_9HYPH|nr:response regulator [Aureimonas jatrophae]MBB3951037.1 DNA-binding response OmpR family regulator [Aureimonas jatrophae]SDO53043.1 Response regulator receiver domain-containing protein [Aureimonas jatrophae]